jgi:isoleucyl-tRNA synthetase
VEAMPELERYMLHLTAELDSKLRRAVEDFDFNSYTRLLSEFANNDLSAFYFDIRKDVLYCDVNALTGAQSDRRRAYRTVLDTLFHALVRWLAPVLVFTSEEVWGTRFPDAGSVHLLEWPDLGHWEDTILHRRWQVIRGVRSLITEKIEPLRRDKLIGSSLEAEVWLSLREPHFSELRDFDWSEVFISGSVHFLLDRADGTRPDFPAELSISYALSLSDTVVIADESPSFTVSKTQYSLETAVAVRKTANDKCGRCWRHLPEVPKDGALCARCEDVVNG